MRTRLFLLILLLTLLATPAHAQVSLKLESVKVSLWSEYDQPSMLVIYDINLPAGTQLPITLDLRIPQEGNITAVAFVDANGQMLNTEYAGPRADGQWQVITLFIKEDVTYRVEYYQPLTRTDNQRAFDFQWLGDYAVDNFSLEVKIPVDSTAVQTTPNLPFASETPFFIGRLAPTPLAADEAFQLGLNYTRSIDETVFAPSSPQVNASEPVTQNTAGRITLNNLPYILGAVGVVLIVGALYYFQRNAAPQTAVSRKRGHAVSGNAVQVYCHQCGARSNEGDRFCRTCGTKLRVS